MPHSMFVNIRAVQYSQRVCLRFLGMSHLATPASVAEDYVAFVVDVEKRRGERSMTKSLPEPWYGLCVFTELSINRDYFHIQHLPISFHIEDGVAYCAVRSHTSNRGNKSAL